jgi:hypothetical protein
MTNKNNNDIPLREDHQRMDDITTLLKTTLDETKHLREGECFLVKDLFKGYLWNRIPKGDRLMLGSMFLSYITTHTGDIAVMDKGASGQQRYQKL